MVWATRLMYPGRLKGLIRGLGLTAHASICFRSAGMPGDVIGDASCFMTALGCVAADAMFCVHLLDSSKLL